MKDRHKTEQGKKKRKKQTIQGKEKANTITSLKTLDLAPKKQKSTSGGWGGEIQLSEMNYRTGK